MTTTMHRPKPPAVAAGRHVLLRPHQTLARAVRRAIVAAARNVDRPWSIGVDALVLAAFFALMCWEIGEFAFTNTWEHLAAAVVILVAGIFYAFRACTTDRSEQNR